MDSIGCLCCGKRVEKARGEYHYKGPFRINAVCQNCKRKLEEGRADGRTQLDMALQRIDALRQAASKADAAKLVPLSPLFDQLREMLAAPVSVPVHITDCASVTTDKIAAALSCDTALFTLAIQSGTSGDGLEPLSALSVPVSRGTAVQRPPDAMRLRSEIVIATGGQVQLASAAALGALDSVALQEENQVQGKRYWGDLNRGEQSDSSKVAAETVARLKGQAMGLFEGEAARRRSASRSAEVLTILAHLIDTNVAVFDVTLTGSGMLSLIDNRAPVITRPTKRTADPASSASHSSQHWLVVGRPTPDEGPWILLATSKNIKSHIKDAIKSSRSFVNKKAYKKWQDHVYIEKDESETDSE